MRDAYDPSKNVIGVIFVKDKMSSSIRLAETSKVLFTNIQHTQGVDDECEENAFNRMNKPSPCKYNP